MLLGASVGLTLIGVCVPERAGAGAAGVVRRKTGAGRGRGGVSGQEGPGGGGVRVGCRRGRGV